MNAQCGGLVEPDDSSSKILGECRLNLVLKFYIKGVKVNLSVSYGPN